MTLIDILDPKVVDDEGEGDGTSFMEIQARIILGGKYPLVARTFLSCWLASVPACLRPHMARQFRVLDWMRELACAVVVASVVKMAKRAWPKPAV